MNPRAAKILIIIAGLLSTAQTIPNPNPNIGSVQVGDQSVPVRIEYDLAEVLTGSNFKLDVIFTGSNVVDQLKIETFEVQDLNSTAVTPPVIIVVEESATTPTEETPDIRRKVNQCRVTIVDNAVAQVYRIKMTLSYPGTRVEPKHFDLPVWPRTASKGRVTVERLERLPLVFKTNVNTKFDLPVRNDFDSYTIRVKQVTLSSLPAGLIEATLVRDVKIEAERTETIPIEVMALSPDTIDLIKGFSEEPKLRVQITYSEEPKLLDQITNKDDHKRSVPDLRDTIGIKIIPNTTVLFSAIVVGVLVGTFVRFYLEFLARKRKLKRIEVLKFVLYTTIFGLIVAAVALAGQIEIKALDKPMGSYDKPLVMFIIGLAGAIGGVQIIVAWYNSLRPKEDKPDA